MGEPAWSFGEQVPEGAPQAPPPPRLASGAVWAGFRIERPLGRGAMGSVFRARQVSTGREVALKVLHGPSNPQRLRREGELVAGLRHPGIVQLVAAGEEQGLPWLAYELVGDGRTLEDALPGLGREERLDLVHQLCLALGHAHARGVVHRDVKPSNVLLDAAGRARLSDFGLGKGPDAPRLTLSGTLVGTAAYMAPEQLRGEVAALGPWSDVWAVGVLLYRLLCDEPPFPGPSLVELTAQVHEEPPPPPSRRDPSVPPALDRVCLRALALDPARRPPDGEALAAELKAARREATLLAARPRPARSRPLALGAGLLALGAVAAAGILLARRGPGPAGPEPAPASSRAASVDRVGAAREVVLGRLALGRDDLLGAEANARRALELDPGSAEAWELIACVRGQRGDHAGVEEAAGRAIELAPAYGHPYALRSQSRLARHDARGALADAEQAVTYHPRDMDARRVRLWARLWVHDFAGVIEDATARIEAGAGTTEDYANRAWCLGARGEHGAAGPDADRAVELGPEEYYPWAVRSEVRRWRGELQGAAADAERAVELGPQQPYARVVRADVQLQRGDPAAARAEAERAVALGPEDPYSRAALSEALLAGGDAARALAEAEAGLARDSLHPRARLARALAALALGREAEARAGLTQLLRSEPEGSPLAAPARAGLRALER